MTRYVLGFAVSRISRSVLLLRKNRPSWQAGFLNGIGGRIEDGEADVDAMVREFEEETGITSFAPDWRHVIKMRAPDWEVEVFVALSIGIHKAKTQTDEPVEEVSLDNLDCLDVLSNVRWLIEMAQDRNLCGRHIEVVYDEDPARAGSQQRSQ